MRLRHVDATILAAAVLSVAGTAAAAPVKWAESEGGNGHYYEFVPGRVLWEEARAAAAAKTYAGMQGHLATTTSDAERLFVFERTTFTADTRGDAWLGGFQAAGAATPADGWAWVTGEAWDQTFWAPGEPNDGPPGGPDSGLSDQLAMFGAGREPELVGFWNDERGISTGQFGLGPNAGYFVEYSVPEPASAALLTIPLVLLARRRRR